MAFFSIEKLTEQDRSAFDCGSAELNHYLQKQAGQDVRRHAAACFLLIDRRASAVAGFYTLSAASIYLADLPQSLQKKLPRYPTVPAVRIGRLAIDWHYQGQKLGGVLLFDAIKRSHAAELGIAVVLVDAKDERAAEFYEYHGFTALSSDRKIWFLTMSQALKSLLATE